MKMSKIHSRETSSTTDLQWRIWDKERSTQKRNRNKKNDKKTKTFSYLKIIYMAEFYWVPYIIISSKQRKRSIGFKMTHDGLEVRIPFKYNEKMVLLHIEKKRLWIQKTWYKMLQKKEKPSLDSWIQSDTPFILYFWEQYPIQFFHQESKNTSCIFDSEMLRIYHSEDIWKEKKEKLIKAWYKKEATIYLKERTKYLALLHDFITLWDIFIKSYKAKYGMCKWKDIYLDYKIITFEKNIIDHIILHELTHLKYKHHQNSFRNMLAWLDKNWKEHRNFLRGKID
jgi:predicted metal-dependent hydrolase